MESLTRHEKTTKHRKHRKRAEAMGASITVEGWQRCNICDVAVVRMALHVLTKGNLEKGTALGLPEKNEHVNHHPTPVVLQG